MIGDPYALLGLVSVGSLVAFAGYGRGFGCLLLARVVGFLFCLVCLLVVVGLVLVVAHLPLFWLFPLAA